MMPFEYIEECTGQYARQSNFKLKAVTENREVGFIEWSVFEGLASISMIYVENEFRKQGIATQLLKRLQQRDLEQCIDWGGYITPEGVSFLEHSIFHLPNKIFIEASERLVNLERELDLLRGKHQRGEKIDVSIDQWNELHDKQRLAHEVLSTTPAKLSFVKSAGCPAEREWKLMCALAAMEAVSHAAVSYQKKNFAY